MNYKDIIVRNIHSCKYCGGELQFSRLTTSQEGFGTPMKDSRGETVYQVDSFWNCKGCKLEERFAYTTDTEGLKSF